MTHRIWFRLSLLSAALFALVPLAGAAQTHTPYSISMRSQPFQPLPINHPQAGPVLDLTSSVGTSTRVPIDFPVRFFDQDYPRVYICPQGFIEFQDTGSWTFTNTIFPSSAVPNNGIISPWWDDLYFNFTGHTGHVKLQMLGSAPGRTLVVEWRAPHFTTSARNSYAHFQVWLYEGSSTIEFHYGTIDPNTAWTASMGLESFGAGFGYQVPGANGSICNPSCGDAHWLTNTVVTFSQGPELQISQVTGATEAFAGLPMQMSARVTNIGGKPAENFTVRFYISPTRQLGPQSIELMTLDGDLRSLDPQQSTVFEASPRLPITLDEGQYYIIAEADPHRVVPETNRGDNFSAFGPFTIGIRAPNLVVNWVDAPDVLRPGETTSIRWSTANIGNLGAVDIHYVVRLASANTNSPVWPVIGSGSIPALEMEQVKVLTTEVAIPEDAEPGVRYVTVEINPNRAVFEHVYADNFGISAQAMVALADVVVLTEKLPPAQLAGHYNVRLRAMGAFGAPTWRVAEGSSLPPGLSLVEEVGQSGEVATFLEGIPSRAGEFSFAVEVRSGDLRATWQYTLEVLPPSRDLRVVTGHLAEGAFGFPYEDRLMAIGGVPPYTWELVKGELPLGVMLRSDGALSGRPEQDGTFRFTVRVRDDEGRQAAEDLELHVASPSTLTCVTRRLEPLAFGESVQIQLHAAGGQRDAQGGYLWTSVDTAWLATEIGEETTYRKEPPPGLQLTDDGVITGKPSAFGSFLWTVNVRDATGSEVPCSVRFDVPRDRGLTVVTRRLPTAVAGRSYRTQLEASGGDGQLTWSEYGGSRVLDELGLSFDATGSLSGTIPLSVLQGESEREFTLTVRVKDQFNRIGVGVVTLTVREPGANDVKTVADEGGCQAGSGTATPWALALLCLALLRRRR